MITLIEYLIIHWTKSYFGDVPTVTQWHLANGWRDIGYSAMILNGISRANGPYVKELDGRIDVGRGLDISKYIEPNEVGAHTLGYNHNSIGVCLVGDKVKDITVNQWDSLKVFCEFYERIIPGIIIKGHNEVNETTCPGFDVQAWLRADKNGKRLLGGRA